MTQETPGSGLTSGYSARIPPPTPKQDNTLLYVGAAVAIIIIAWLVLKVKKLKSLIFYYSSKTTFKLEKV
jgi:hypothetical protein